ncbi:MAG: type II toxin-antitoxin system HicB family antitoxin [Deltaproteobacteria bacterium]|nr:type II toxin-antitoxin system HicB family antitoxin [Deltaproteobacteria bacterium]
MSIYTVTYERDESGWWFASVREVQGCHTQGRTIKEARRRIREALALFVADAKRAQLVDEVVLPDDVQGTIDSYNEARQALEAALARSKQETGEAARVLARKLTLSVRDTGDILGLSHQRIQQVLADRQPAKKHRSTQKARRSGGGQAGDDSFSD